MLRPPLQGHTNPGFLSSLSAASLRSWPAGGGRQGPHPQHFTAMADPDTDLDEDSFLSDLEVGSARGKEGEKTPGLEELHHAVTLELDEVLQRAPPEHPAPRLSRPPSSLGRGSRRFTPRSTAPPPPIQEEEEVVSRGSDGRISLMLQQKQVLTSIMLGYFVTAGLYRFNTTFT